MNIKRALKPKLVKDWRRVVSVGFSFWASVAGLVVLLLPELVYIGFEIDLNPRATWLAGFLLILFGIIGRLFEQSESKLREWLKIGAALVLIAAACFVFSTPSYAATTQAQTDDALDIAVPLIAKWEGYRPEAYLDIVGVPTICYGSTKGVELGMRLTKRQCARLLRKEVAEHRDGWLEYVTREAVQKWLPAARDAAYTSLAYNIGSRRAGRSTATRRLNVGNIRGGCDALGWWNRAGGRVIRGLVNRRTEETILCLRA